MSIKQSLQCKLGKHQWGEWQFLPETCKQQRNCTFCQAQETREHAHQFEWVVGEDTCQQQYLCVRCRQVRETRQGPHSWGEWADIPGTGEQQRICTLCQSREIRLRPAQLRRDKQGFGALIEIQAGPFVMGTRQDEIPELLQRFGGWRDEYERETPQHELTLPGYWIGQAPVTVAQFRSFVRKSGYDWKGAGEKQGGDDHPVVEVSWNDAQAFCEWLTSTWRASGQIEANEEARLPSEAEWEKAARGTDGRIFPWGNDVPDGQRCNFNNHTGTTTTVGKYSPQGDSPYGCVDMVGNVFEWTRSLWSKTSGEPEYTYPYEPGDGRENQSAVIDIPRVIRGNCYGSEAWAIRAASRSRYRLDVRNNHVGFRICVAIIQAEMQTDRDKGANKSVSPENFEGEIVGYKASVDLIFDRALGTLPVLTESQFQAAYCDVSWGQTWMSPTYQGTAEEIKNYLLECVDPMIKMENYRVFFFREEGREHLKLVLEIPGGFDIVVILYSTEDGVRAVANKKRIRSS